MNPAAAPVRQPAPVPAPAPAPALALGQPNPIRDGLNDLKLELRAQSLIKQIREFDGESSRKFRDWLREIDRAGTIVNATDDDDCIITAVTPAKRPARPQPSHNVTVSEQRHTAVSQHTKSSTVTSTVSSNAANTAEQRHIDTAQSSTVTSRPSTSPTAIPEHFTR